MATLEVVERAMELLARSKPGTDLATVSVEVYALVLEPVPDDVLLQAAVVLARSPGAFLPDAGTLYETSMDLTDQEPPAEDAWLLVLKHSRNASLGRDNPVQLPVRAARALRRIGGDEGWKEDEFPFRRKEFLEVYGTLRARERREAALALPEGDARKLIGE